MKLAVVIPALNESDRIERGVRSALAPEVEVVVADGGSQDDTARRAQRAGARVIAAPRGRARQMAAGAQASSGDVVLFLHADTVLPPGYAGALREALGDPGLVGGSFALRFEERAPLLRFIEWGVGLRMALLNLPYGDQALFVRRGVLDRIGGVPDAPIMEDLDLVKRMKQHGRLARIPLAVTTSARRYAARGPLRTMLRNWGALVAWRLDLDRQRVADWYRR